MGGMMHVSNMKRTYLTVLVVLFDTSLQMQAECLKAEDLKKKKKFHILSRNPFLRKIVFKEALLLLSLCLLF